MYTRTVAQHKRLPQQTSRWLTIRRGGGKLRGSRHRKTSGMEARIQSGWPGAPSLLPLLPLPLCTSSQPGDPLPASAEALLAAGAERSQRSAPKRTTRTRRARGTEDGHVARAANPRVRWASRGERCSRKSSISPSGEGGGGVWGVGYSGAPLSTLQLQKTDKDAGRRHERPSSTYQSAWCEAALQEICLLLLNQLALALFSPASTWRSPLRYVRAKESCGDLAPLSNLSSACSRAQQREERRKTDENAFRRRLEKEKKERSQPGLFIL
ncbi:hypothetical protein AOLI_G00132990 [Acnodon oligacanthus]